MLHIPATCTRHRSPGSRYNTTTGVHVGKTHCDYSCKKCLGQVVELWRVKENPRGYMAIMGMRWPALLKGVSHTLRHVQLLYIYSCIYIQSYITLSLQTTNSCCGAPLRSSSAATLKLAATLVAAVCKLAAAQSCNIKLSQAIHQHVMCNTIAVLVCHDS